MVKTTFLASSLLAFAAAAQSLRFTGPSTSEALDITTEINITWGKGNSSEEHDLPPKFTLEWFTHPVKNQSIGSEIQTDLDVSDGEYKWKPSTSTINMLKPFWNELYDNKFEFQAVFYNETDPTLTLKTVSSGKYAVIGLKDARSGGETVGLPWGVLAGGLATVGMMLV
ncbi:uncharacterized protein FIESC28_05882 [Fusarium coffeatum]|uniref:Uncharacterized protein n=1 Tax=Fusarium coffeatum TaxID=231269 RepID=A0A366RNP2_9HYPO|nr:uncharacterized protein FIESC28_05882 [Fusarium coffeatum]RBR18741.1 hypothetical protein FIESC28_05882 [Fusarium coffeatum]